MKIWIVVAIMCIENVSPMRQGFDREPQGTDKKSILSDTADCIVQDCQILSEIDESYGSNSMASPIYALFDNNNGKNNE